MPISRSALVLALFTALAACTDTTDPSVGTGRMRIVNSVFQGADVTTAVPVAIDVLIDSSMSGAGLGGLAAPMADPKGNGQGTDISATFAGGAGDTLTATAPYRGTSGYVNPPAGSYTLTLTSTLATSDTTSTTFTLYSGTVTLAKGEVRTFLVQSTAYAATPGPGNTKVTNLLDNQW